MKALNTYLIIVCMCVYNMIHIINLIRACWYYQEGLALRRLAEASDV